MQHVVNHVGYVVDQGGRGTLDILWSCIVTIVLCTWTIQRLQLVLWDKSRTIIVRKKAFWMLITLLCPEYVTWIAFEQWQSARQFRTVRALGHKSWTMRQAYYVDMGGLYVSLGRHRDVDAAEKAQEIKPETALRYQIRLRDLITLLTEKALPLPDIPLEDLSERSKNDEFARVVTLVQVLYFLVVTFGRAASGLPISTLEVSTLAFICCAALVEFFWWKKPLDLRSPTVISIVGEDESRFRAVLPQLQFNLSEQDLAEKVNVKLFFDRMLWETDMRRSTAHALWIGCVFNGIHISGWNFSFPSDAESLLWRIASVGACGAVVAMWASSFLTPKMLAILLTGLFAGFYCLCRIYLMVEIFIGLRSSPMALYESAAWQNVLPGV